MYPPRPPQPGWQPHRHPPGRPVPVGLSGPRPWYERGARAVGHFAARLWVPVVCFFPLIVSVAFTGLAREDSALVQAWCYAALFLGIGVLVLVYYRRQWPVPSVYIASAIAVAFPTDGVSVVVLYSWVISTSRRRRDMWLTGACAALAVAASLWRDAARPAADQVFSLKDADGLAYAEAPWWLYVALGVVALALAVFVGWARRQRVEADLARREVARQEARAGALRDDVARKDQRDVFAREMHDTLAQSLSRVSLGADLVSRLAPPDADDLRRAAGVVQENAHRSLQDLRGLIERLRDPAVTAIETGSLDQISRLFEAARGDNAQVMATVMIDDPSSAPPQLARTVYRVLQECLTNVEKHAPGIPVTVDVSGAPGRGVHIHVSNRMPPTPRDAVAGSRTGLVGMAERVRLVGGLLRYGRRGEEFVVDADLPWPVRGAVAHGLLWPGDPRPDR